MSNCSICLENHSHLDTITTNCNHTFGKVCINQWLNRNNSCPLCRSVITNVNIIKINPVNTSRYDEHGNLINRRQNYLDLYLDGNLQYEEVLNMANNFH